jgi:predicted nucleotidyltransferase
MREIKYPSKNITEFLDFMSDALPSGDIYLFGGILRDMALFGRKGFNSDIDLVVEGSWHNCVSYLESLGARKNKFDGYRLEVAGWPIDIWNAKETWAIKQGYVSYMGIASLTETTVLNWDAILMNWRTRNFICREDYLQAINAKLLDIVLEENPNPLGMAVRVFRHLCLKEAQRVTPSAANYLATCTSKFTFDEIKRSEISSYGNTAIEPAVYELFEYLNHSEHLDIRERFNEASDHLKRVGVCSSYMQTRLNFENFLESSHA